MFIFKFVFNVSEPLTLLLILMLTIFVIILGKETKKAFIPAILLFSFLIVLIVHTAQLLGIFGLLEQDAVLTRCIVWDFVFILLSFISYLWIDDIDAKAHNKKSIDNSLDWFWNKV